MALEALIDRYQRPVYNAAYRLLGNAEDARDIAQTVFLKVVERLDAYDSQYKFFSWIYRIAVNESLNALRTSGREQPVTGLETQPAASNPENVADRTEIGKQVQTAMMQMTTEGRVVLTLKHILGLSYREISGVVGVPEKTVKSRLFAARRHLRETLESRRGELV